MYIETTWQGALEAWAKGVTIKVRMLGQKELVFPGENKLLLAWGNPIDKKSIREGEWFMWVEKDE